MSIRVHLVCLTAVALAACEPLLAVAGDGATAPRLQLRATPSLAFSPVEVRVLGRLVGGDDLERFYCPAVVWEWGDGSRSARQSDCPPFAEDARLDRFFSAAHRYRASGEYQVRLTLRRGGRLVAAATTRVVLRSRAARDDRNRDPAIAGSALRASTGRRAHRSTRSSEVLP